MRAVHVAVVAIAITFGATISFGAPTDDALDVELASRADVRGTLSSETGAFTYAAVAGATLSFKLVATPARGVTFDVRLVGPDATAIDLAGLPRFVQRDGFVSVSRASLPLTGSYVLRVRGPGSGTYRLDWTASPGPKRVQRCDLRCTTLGRSPGSESAAGRIIRAGTGTSVSVTRTDSDVRGAAIVVQGGAAPAETVVLLTSAPAARPRALAGLHVAGPSIAIEPDGLRLGAAAAVTVPYDPVRVPHGSNAASQLRMARVDAHGTTTVIAPDSVDTESHVVTAPSDRFARFVVVAPDGPPDPEAVAYWHGALTVRVSPDGGGGTDSRHRDVSLDVGRATLLPGGGLDVVGDWYGATWTTDNAGVGQLSLSSALGESGTIKWAMDADGRRLRVIDPSGGGSVLEPCADGSLYVGTLGEDTTGPQSTIEIALRRPPSDLPTAALVGSYWVGVQEFGVSQSGQSPTSVEIGRTFGVVTLRADGTWSLKGDSISTRADWSEPDGRTRRSSARESGTWAVATPSDSWYAGTVMLSSANGPGRVRIFPSADGALFFGTNDPAADGGAFAFLFGVRQARAITPSDVKGDYAFAQMTPDANAFRLVGLPPAPAELVVPDVRCWQEDGIMRFAGTSTVRIPADRLKEVDRDGTVPGGVRVTYDASTAQSGVGFTLARTGRFDVRAGANEQVVGAVSADARAGFVVIAPVKPNGAYGLRVFVKAP
ncbi:MAG: hypothetical protein K8T90_05865 [Planctomycetes bacterium]|nr:hypothetical protein [Planctomycetota bacterium]